VPIHQPSDVSAVVCTKDSISSIRPCLVSLRASGVGEIVVVDANSTDGTLEIAHEFAGQVLADPGIGLGNARNIGIAGTCLPLVLNFGSDNVMPAGQLPLMIDALEAGQFQGVSAQTRISDRGFLPEGLNRWRRGRFVPGPAAVIGTPTLFVGEMLRSQPYDTTRRFSDDSELCERWTREFGARFGISEAWVEEIGKTSWPEVKVRCRMYGESDYEVFRAGRMRGWGVKRSLKSLSHPLRADFVEPIVALGPREGALAAPFLAVFTSMRYAYWAKSATGANR
jgi:glycosyltransferase involved in cell wall biosynthesis